MVLASTAAFAGVNLDIATIRPGALSERIYLLRHPDSLGFGKTPSRFSDPRRRAEENRLGVLYLGSTLKVSFLEAILRVFRRSRPLIPTRSRPPYRFEAGHHSDAKPAI
jgi:hypothetical protein